MFCQEYDIVKKKLSKKPLLATKIDKS